MVNLKITPDPNLVYSLYTGIAKPQIIRLSLLLDVYTPLLAGPLTVGEVAAKCECDEEGFQFLLDYLRSVDVLVKN